MVDSLLISFSFIFFLTKYGIGRTEKIFGSIPVIIGCGQGDKLLIFSRIFVFGIVHGSSGISVDRVAQYVVYLCHVL